MCKWLISVLLYVSGVCVFGVVMVVCIVNVVLILILFIECVVIDGKMCLCGHDLLWLLLVLCCFVVVGVLVFNVGCCVVFGFSMMLVDYDVYNCGVVVWCVWLCCVVVMIDGLVADIVVLWLMVC